jgi:sirohydrochlorin cobaltochelatase
MTGPHDAVVLVGHGAVPADCPRELVQRLKVLESRRRASGGAISTEETELDARIRRWPRAPDSDPYAAGVEALAARLRPLVGAAMLAIAYNEFAAPTVAEAVAHLITQGARRITIVPTMLTPGGVHSEVEIPETLATLRILHPSVELRYAWPFDLDAVAGLLAGQLRRVG